MIAKFGSKHRTKCPSNIPEHFWGVKDLTEGHNKDMATLPSMWCQSETFWSQVQKSDLLSHLPGKSLLKGNVTEKQTLPVENMLLRAVSDFVSTISEGPVIADVCSSTDPAVKVHASVHKNRGTEQQPVGTDFSLDYYVIGARGDGVLSIRCSDSDIVPGGSKFIPLLFLKTQHGRQISTALKLHSSAWTSSLYFPVTFHFF